MIRSLHFTFDGGLRQDLKASEYSQALKDGRGLLWVDFEATSAQDGESILRQQFDFHPLAIDDALQETHTPKVDDWDNYLYIVLEDIIYYPKGGNIELNELDVFLGKNYIVTYHDLPIQSINRVWDFCQHHDRHVKMGADHLLYRMVDELVTDYMLAVDEMDDEIDAIEDRVFSNPSPDVVQRIFTLKRATTHLRRVISPMREVLNKLARDDYRVIDTKDRIYFRDVYDHLVRLYDITEGLRDLVGGSLDTYLSVVNNRMNDIMKVLTIITTLFMPISFITGFFGMNFFQPVASQLMPWTSLAIFVIAVLVMLLLPVSMFLWMKFRRWTDHATPANHADR